MDKHPQVKQILQKTIDAIIVNSLFNEYALENIVVGKSKPNDKIDFSEYCQTLKLSRYSRETIVRSAEGFAVTHDGHIADKDEDLLLMEYFSGKMEIVLAKYSKEKYDIHEYLPFEDSLRDYLTEVFYLFKQIVNTPVEYNCFDVIPYFDNDDEERQYFINLKSFVLAIRDRHLRQGSVIEKYLKKLPFIPPAVQPLIKTINGHRVLKTNDPSGIDYKLALLSLIKFFKKENYRIFELKMMQWRKNLNL